MDDKPRCYLTVEEEPQIGFVMVGEVERDETGDFLPGESIRTQTVIDVRDDPASEDGFIVDTRDVRYHVIVVGDDY